MSDERDKEQGPADLRVLAMQMLDQPDKELGLLWGDLLRVVDQGRDPSATHQQALRGIFELYAQKLAYLGKVTSEIRYRLEALEFAAGVKHQKDGEPLRFPPSGDSFSVDPGQG